MQKVNGIGRLAGFAFQINAAVILNPGRRDAGAPGTILGTGSCMKLKMWLFFAAITVFLLWQAFNAHWFAHIHTDINVFWWISSTFCSQGSWAHIDTNAYQPGALWFFLGVSQLTPAALTRDGFLFAMVLANIVLLLLHFTYFLYLGNKWSAFIFSLIALGMGPIIFFRFELLVSALCLLSWHLFSKRNSDLSASFVLGLGSAVKIYPVVLFPFYLAEVLQAKAIGKVVSRITAFAAGVALPVVMYFATDGSWNELFKSLSFNNLKPISLESFWGNIITLIQKAGGMPVRPAPAYGINGLYSDIFLNAQIVNQIWIVIFSLTVLWLLWKFRPNNYRNVLIPFIVLLQFVALSKTPNPQYMWWIFVFLPLVPLSLFSFRERIIVLASTFCSLVLTQILYPLFYSEFLAFYFTQNRDYWWVFGVCSLRNLLLILIMIYAFKAASSECLVSAKVGSRDIQNEKPFSPKPMKKGGKKRGR
jgi:hypothetical protein